MKMKKQKNQNNKNKIVDENKINYLPIPILNNTTTNSSNINHFINDTEIILVPNNTYPN